MRWFREQLTIPSEKNGQIIATRSWGTWTIRVGGYDETTPYLRDMWRKAFTMLPRDFRPKKILMLGLGAGGEVGSAQEYFPKAHITVIEWDEAMIALAKRCALFVFNDSLLIKTGDARALLPTLTDTFDLILVDLFTGPAVSPLVTEETFAAELQKRITPNGHMLVNIFRSPQALRSLDAYFGRQKLWRYKYNRMAFYRPHGCGTIGDPLPAGFTLHKQSPLYIRHSEFLELVGVPGAYGTKRTWGTYASETYTTDVEPTLAPHRGIRLITWQPITRTDRPRGWFRLGQPTIKMTGFTQIIHPETYWTSWTNHAKRHRSAWLKNPLYTIERIDSDSFIRAYKQESHLTLMKHPFARVVAHNARHHGDRLVCFGAKDAHGSIVAGLAVLDLPDVSTSNHTISFIAKRARHTSVGTGLIDEWFRHCIRTGIHTLNFGTFAIETDPASWRGFTQFKGQFGTRYIRYPKPLYKISW